MYTLFHRSQFITNYINIVIIFNIKAIINHCIQKTILNDNCSFIVTSKLNKEFCMTSFYLN